MAEKSVLTFNNNCATNNRIGAEVIESPIKDDNMHITDTININNSRNDIQLNSSDVCTQEEAGEEFLAGENKWESERADDELLEDATSDNLPEAEEEFEDQPNELCDYEENKLTATYNGNSNDFECETTERQCSVR